MLLFEEKLPPAPIGARFKQKVKQVAANLEIDPNWLMAVIDLETGGTFNPAARNPHTGATGLIQFMPNTAQALGTSTSALAQMNFMEQLDYVERYYKPYAQHINSLQDLYLATFFPAAISKPDSYVLATQNISARTIARQNPYFDFNRDGKITVGEIKMKLFSRLPARWASRLKQNPGTTIAVSLGLIGLGFAIWKWPEIKELVG